MKITKKYIINFGFVLLIGLMIYPPTKVYFIRLISFSPSTENVENQQKIKNPDWQLIGLNTTNVNFKELEGKVVFINFWATWCPPCIAEMPSIKKLYEAYKDEVVFLFVTNEDWETVSKFYNKKEYNFPTYNSIGKTLQEFESSAIPATFIVSKEGKIVVDKKGPADWYSNTSKEIIESLLQNP